MPHGGSGHGLQDGLEANAPGNRWPCSMVALERHEEEWLTGTVLRLGERRAGAYNAKKFLVLRIHLSHGLRLIRLDGE
jgi:hypothetical protein